MLSKQVYQDVKEVADRIGIPEDVWVPIALLESDGNPLAHTVTKKEDSRGIFQVNILSQTGANKSALFNAKYNAEFQLPELKRYYDKGVSKGLSGAELTTYVERYGQRPDWKDPKNVIYITGKINSYFSNKGSSILDKNSSVGMVQNASSLDVGGLKENTLDNSKDVKTGEFFEDLEILSYQGAFVLTLLGVLILSVYKVFIWR